MGTPHLFQAFLLVGTLAASGYFAMSEYAIASANKELIRQWADNGDCRARQVLMLASSYSKVLAAVRLGAAFLALFAATMAGASLVESFAGLLESVLSLERTPALLLAGLFVAFLFASLAVFCWEIFPRRIALRSPERIAMATARTLVLFVRSISPIMSVLVRASEGLLRRIGLDAAGSTSSLAEGEIKLLIEQGTETGAFAEAERDMMVRVLAFGDLKIRQLMTPRPKVVWLDLEDSIEVNSRKLKSAPYSHFPIARGSLDSLLGTMHVRDFVCGNSLCVMDDLVKLAKPPVLVPEGMSALKVLERFKASGSHIAYVIDEYGVIEGVVTMTDMLESIVGDVNSRRLPVSEAEVTQVEENVWILSGMLEIEEFRSLLGIIELPGHERVTYQTLAGFLLSLMGRIPMEGEVVQWESFHFTVERMVQNRIDRVRAARVPLPCAKENCDCIKV
jgi:putative hemolysin